MYRWRLILEEYGPEIVYIKGIDNTVADAISRLQYTPALNPNRDECQNWMTFTKRWCRLDTGAHNYSATQHMESMNHVFANRSDDEEIFPITVKEIAEAQKKDKTILNLCNKEKLQTLLIENTEVLCKDKKLVIPKSLQAQIVQWYHHYLQHLGHSRLEECYALRCIGKVCVLLSDHMSKSVDPAKLINDEHSNTVNYHQKPSS